MASYVIAKKGKDLLDTPVFHAGPSGNEEAIAVFTNADSADRYITAAGWTDEHEVGELNAFQLLRWLIKAHEEGIRFLTVDPNRTEQAAGDQQQVVVIEDKLTGLAESLDRDIFGR